MEQALDFLNWAATRGLKPFALHIDRTQRSESLSRTLAALGDENQFCATRFYFASFIFVKSAGLRRQLLPRVALMTAKRLLAIRAGDLTMLVAHRAHRVGS
jgi:hypothetical protein